MEASQYLLKSLVCVSHWMICRIDILIHIAYYSHPTGENNPSVKSLSTSARTSSVGHYVKSKLVCRNSEIDGDILYSLPSRKLSKWDRKPTRSPQVELFTPLIDLNRAEDVAPLGAQTPGKL